MEGVGAHLSTLFRENGTDCVSNNSGSHASKNIMGIREGKGGRTMKFWEKASKCSHVNLSPVYLENIKCDTPFCGGSETHCLDCGVFIIKCGCGYCDGISGWPDSRYRKVFKRKVDGQ